MQPVATPMRVDVSAPASRRMVPLVFLGLALGVLWFVLCRHLSQEWRLNEQYSYGWFVPFFALYLFWLRWEDRPERFQISDFRFQIAVIGIIAAALLLLPLRVFEIANPDWRPLGWVHGAAAVAITFAIIYLIGGGRWLRHFAFPILFFSTAVPWPSPIETPIVQGLMRAVAAAAAETVSLFGVPAEVQGNLIRLSNGVVGVNEACSGVRSLQTSLMIGLLFGELKRLSFGRRTFLVLAAVTIAMIANFGRSLFLVSIAARENIAAVGKWHDAAGYGILLLVFAGTMWTASKLGSRNAKVENKSPSPSSTFHFLPSTFYFSLFTWLLLVELVAEGWYRAHEQAMASTPGWTVRWPESAPGFREIPIDEGVRQTLRFDDGREAVWNLNPPHAEARNASRCYLYFFRWKPGGSSVVRARAHRPDICLPSSGWKPIHDSGTRTYAVGEGQALPFRHVDFALSNSTATARTFFCLHEDRRTNETRSDLQLAAGIQPDWSFPARWRAVREGVRNMGQQVLEIVILSTDPVQRESTEAEFAQLLPRVIQPSNSQ